MSMYEPQKKSYHSLNQLAKELMDAGVEIDSFDGFQIRTKHQIFTLFDGQIQVTSVSH